MDINYPFNKIPDDSHNSSPDYKLFIDLLKQIGKINNDEEKTMSISNIIRSTPFELIHTNLNVLEELINIADEINDDFYRCDIIKELSPVIITANLTNSIFMDQIINYVKKIYLDEDRSESLIYIIRNIYKIKSFDYTKYLTEIIILINNMRSSNYKSKTYSYLIDEFKNMDAIDKETKIGFVENIIEDISNISDNYKSEPLCEVVKFLVANTVIKNNVSFILVITIIKTIKSSKIKTKIIENIILQILSINNKLNTSNLEHLFFKLIEAIIEINSDNSKAKLYCLISDVLSSEEGQYLLSNDEKNIILRKIVINAEKIQNSYHKSDTFKQIIQSLAKNKNISEAIYLLEVIEDDKNKRIAINYITHELFN